ncbi:unnamed protein product, partial [Ectocarpus sp. 12 AP-2014]
LQVRQPVQPVPWHLADLGLNKTLVQGGSGDRESGAESNGGDRGGCFGLYAGRQ